MGLGGGPASRLQGRTEAPAIQVPALRRAPASRKMPAGPSLNNPVPPQRSAYNTVSVQDPQGRPPRGHSCAGVPQQAGRCGQTISLYTERRQRPRRKGAVASSSISPPQRQRDADPWRVRPPLRPGRPPRVPRLNPKAPQVPFGPPQTVLQVKSTHVHLPSCPQIGDHGSAHSL